MAKPGPRAYLLLLPVVLLFGVFGGGPFVTLLLESLKPFESGRIGGLEDAGFTLANFGELMEPAYLFYLYDTFRIGLIATGLGILVGFPVAYYIARVRRLVVRKLWIAGLIGMLFLSIIVRVYAIYMTYGPVGPLRGLSAVFGMTASGPDFLAVQVIIGLLHIIIPLVALTILGTVQNVSPTLEEAAQALGATRVGAFFTITLPLCMPGIAAAFVIAYAFCVSNFVIPLVLGKGIVLFVSNLIYIRFSEISNFPSGSAIAIIMLVVSLLLVYGLISLIRLRWRVD